jgi:hypothetical protein
MYKGTHACTLVVCAYVSRHSAPTQKAHKAFAMRMKTPIQQATILVWGGPGQGWLEVPNSVEMLNLKELITRGGIIRPGTQRIDVLIRII